MMPVWELEQEAQSAIQARLRDDTPPKEGKQNIIKW